MKIYKDGARYHGEWLIGTSIRQGRGIEVRPSKNIYKGYWVNDMANGKGKLIYANGDIYDGQWKDGNKSGNGT